MKNNFSLKSSVQKGFSLVELLVVIAVIAIIAAIAIPNISQITQQANIAKSKRNAQTIASLASSAQAAGNTTYGDTEAEVVANLIAGVTAVLNGQVVTFQLGTLNANEIANAAPYFDVDPADNIVTYNP